MNGQQYTFDNNVAEVYDSVGMIAIGVRDQSFEVFSVEGIVGEGDELFHVLSFDVVDDLIA